MEGEGGTERDGSRERERPQEEGVRRPQSQNDTQTRIYIFRKTPCSLSAVTSEFIREGGEGGSQRADRYLMRWMEWKWECILISKLGVCAFFIFVFYKECVYVCMHTYVYVCVYVFSPSLSHSML